MLRPLRARVAAIGSWSAAPVSITPDNVADFVSESRFLAFASVSADGHADASPKGDPAGSLAVLEEETLWFADRPGNRRVDSFRNILSQPEVSFAMLIPGANMVLTGRGRCELTTNEAARQGFEVQGKVPALAVAVHIHTMELHSSPSLERANLWPVKGKPDDINPTKLFLEQMKLNRQSGFGLKLMASALNAPGISGLVQKGVDKSLKDNLY